MAETRITAEQLENIAIRVLDVVPSGAPDENGNRIYKYICTFKQPVRGGKLEKTSVELYGTSEIATGFYLPAPSLKWLTIVNNVNGVEKRSAGNKPIFKLGPYLHP